MPSKKQRARAAKAAKAAAQAAEPPRQPALEGPRTLQADVRSQIRSVRRVRRSAQSFIKADESAVMNHQYEHSARGKVIATRNRLQAKLINRACVAAIAALDTNDTA